MQPAVVHFARSSSVTATTTSSRTFKLLDRDDDGVAQILTAYGRRLGGSVRDTDARGVGAGGWSRGVRLRGLQLLVERGSHRRAHWDPPDRRSAARLSIHASSIVV
jgi:hypothetical protein